MKRHYYFVASSLPPLKIGDVPQLSFAELETLLKQNLAPADYLKTRLLKRYYDILNLRAFWRGEPLDPYGERQAGDLEEAVLEKVGFPPYVLSFLDRFEKREERIAHFPQLLASFFQEEEAQASGFLRNYLSFERELRLVLVGFRAKRLGRDVAKELQFENPQEESIAQILAQKDAQTFDPPTRFQDLKPLLEKYASDPLELYQAVNAYRFEKIEEMTGLDETSIDRILGYMAQLIIVERRLALDKEKGLKIVKNIVKGPS